MVLVCISDNKTVIKLKVIPPIFWSLNNIMKIFCYVVCCAREESAPPAGGLAGRAEVGGPEEPTQPAGDLAGRATSVNVPNSISSDRLAVHGASI